jgi:hypothetical protein
MTVPSFPGAPSVHGGGVRGGAEAEPLLHLPGPLQGGHHPGTDTFTYIPICRQLFFLKIYP